MKNSEGQGSLWNWSLKEQFGICLQRDFLIGFFNGDLFTVIKVVRGFTGPHISHM